MTAPDQDALQAIVAALADIRTELQALNRHMAQAAKTAKPEAAAPVPGRGEYRPVHRRRPAGRG